MVIVFHLVERQAPGLLVLLSSVIDKLISSVIYYKQY